LAQENYEEARSRLREALTLALEIKTWPVVLTGLVGLTQLLVRAKEIKRAAEVLALVQHHPAADFETKQQAKLQFAKIKPQLSAQTIETILAQTPGKSLEEEAVEILKR
jgi:hypothetical protein